MEITRDRVDQVEAVRSLVEEMIEYAREHESTLLDEENLVLLEAQLDGLHQALSVAVAQKEGLDDFFGDGDGD